MDFGTSSNADDAQDDSDAQAQAELPCTLMRGLRGHEGPVLAVRFNAQGSYCISCGKVGTVAQASSSEAS